MPSHAMVVSALACLATTRGDLRICDLAALRAVIELLPERASVYDSNEDGYEGFASEGAAAGRLDGFALAEWAAFARKKAAIASSVAKLNGERKKRIHKLAAVSRDHSVEMDCVYAHDPWMGKQLGSSSMTSVEDTSNAHAQDPWVKFADFREKQDVQAHRATNEQL